jgi:hypothetical protein
MTTETITWTPVTEGLPDADTTVLLSLDGEHDEPTWIGFHDGNRWLDISGMPIQGVIGWADMPAGLRTPAH